jgi:preprotein translocase SecF subunit
MKFITIFDPKTEVNFVGMMPTLLKVMAGLVVISLGSLAALGIEWGLDFTGGTEMQVKFDKEVGAGELREVLVKAGFPRNQVQQYGTAADHEMLLKVERLTSLTDETITKITDLLKDNHGKLSPGAEKGADAITVDFRAEEGDRITVKLPEPKVGGAPQKNTDPAAAQAALETALGAAGTPEAKPLDDAAIDAMSAQGFDRTVVAAKARELGYTVSAAAPKLVEPIVDDAVALQNALNAQEDLLSELLDTQSGAKLRRARRAGETESTTEDAVTRSEPYQGMVKYAVQFRGVSVDIEKALRDKFGAAEIRRVDFVDAQVAKQLQTDGLLAVIYALLLILVYVAIRFDFFFSPGAVIALVHDAIGALLVFSLGRMEFVLPSIAALLTVVGYSINNTIVIYDRIRETVPTDTKKPLSDDEVSKYVNRAINDTFSRTINTSLTTLCASVALAVFAGGVVQNFAIVLSVGILLGALSSTFLAPATYLWFRKNFQTNEPTKARGGLSREDKARGVV